MLFDGTLKYVSLDQMFPLVSTKSFIEPALILTVDGAGALVGSCDGFRAGGRVGTTVGDVDGS